jgi:hypothetical protein
MISNGGQVIIEQEAQQSKKKHILHSSFISKKLSLFINIFFFLLFLILLFYINNQHEKKIVFLERNIDAVKLNNLEQNQQIIELNKLITQYNKSFEKLESKISQIDLLQKTFYEANKKIEDFEKKLTTKNTAEKQYSSFENHKYSPVNFEVVCEKIYKLAKDGKDFSFAMQDLYKIDPKFQEDSLLKKLAVFSNKKLPTLEEIKKDWKKLSSILKQEVIFSNHNTDDEVLEDIKVLGFWQKIWFKISKIIRIEKVKKNNNKDLILEKISEMLELNQFNEVLGISEEINSTKYLTWKNKLKKRIELEEILSDFVIWFKNHDKSESEHQEKL